MCMAAALLVLSWSLTYSMAASSSAAALHVDADCEKNFARGVEAYELGLQSNDPQHFEEAVKVGMHARLVARF